MRTRITVLVVKISYWVLHLFHRGGSLPGKLALRLQPDVLNHVHTPKDIILVTGTNGKTTTNNMVYETMKLKYTKVICNQRGDNLLVGIVALIARNTKMNLRVNADCMVLEVDELNVPHVLKYLTPSCIVVTNFFRDQLDRAGEMERVVSKVEESLTLYENNLVLNGNDPNVVRLADAATKARVSYFGVDKGEDSTPTSKEANEGKFCVRCNAPLVYDYYQYSHVGSFSCPNCSFGHIKVDYVAHDIKKNPYRFVFQEFEFIAPQDAMYSLYNCMSVLSVANVYNIELQPVKEILESFELNDGRNETFDIGRPCLLNLVKNPTGTNEVLKYITRDDQDKDVVFVLNDNDQDGRDVSWIWDAHFDLLCVDSTKTIICSGKRAYDAALRFKYNNYQGNLVVKESIEDALQYLKSQTNSAYIIATYTALQPMREQLKRQSK